MKWFIVKNFFDGRREFLKVDNLVVWFNSLAEAKQVVDELLIDFARFGWVRVISDIELRRRFGIFELDSVWNQEERFEELLNVAFEGLQFDKNWVLAVNAGIVRLLGLVEFAERNAQFQAVRLERWDELYDLWAISGWRGRIRFVAMFLLDSLIDEFDFDLSEMEWSWLGLLNHCLVWIDLCDCLDNACVEVFK